MLAYALLASTLVIAACGLVYELLAGALASYLIGDTLTQFSTVIGTYLFAMGVGAYACQYLKRDLLARFVHIEILVGVTGGFSGLGLFLAFASGLPLSPLLYAVVTVVGVLVGLEIPLLLRILREQLCFEVLVSRVLSFDYLGALFASLAFPLWFVPQLGLVRTGLFFGLVNLLVAALTLYLFRDRIGRRMWVAVILGTAALGAALLWAERLQRFAESQLYADPIVHAVQTSYQRIVLTHRQGRTSLYLNGHLQFQSGDEHRYHETLVHPLLSALPEARRVLILGGGDGLAVRELRRYAQIEHMTLVDLDPGVTELARRHPLLVALNGGAFEDRRLTVVHEDAWRYLERHTERYDAVLIDLPDPNSLSLGRLYSTTFYRLLARRLAPGGGVVVQATSPLFAREAYWSVVTTLEAAGYHASPYHVYVPSFGEWGFVLAARAGTPSPVRGLPADLRYLTPEAVPGLFVFPPDMARVAVQPNRLDNQILVRYYEHGWRASLID